MSFAQASVAAPSLLSEAAETQPLLCLIDDAQWLDRPSAKALAFASAVFSRGRSPWCSQPASRSRSSEKELDRYDVRGLKNARGYSGAALTCRVCGRMIVVDEALRIDDVLELWPAAWRATANLDRRLNEVSERGIDGHHHQRETREPVNGWRLIDAEDQRRDHAPWLLRASRDRAGAYERWARAGRRRVADAPRALPGLSCRFIHLDRVGRRG
jgi:hypothetical protein